MAKGGYNKEPWELVVAWATGGGCKDGGRGRGTGRETAVVTKKSPMETTTTIFMGFVVQEAAPDTSGSKARTIFPPWCPLGTRVRKRPTPC